MLRCWLLTSDQLDTWIDAVLDAESIDAVFGRPTAH